MAGLEDTDGNRVQKPPVWADLYRMLVVDNTGYGNCSIVNKRVQNEMGAIINGMMSEGCGAPS